MNRLSLREQLNIAAVGGARKMYVHHLAAIASSGAVASRGWESLVTNTSHWANSAVGWTAMSRIANMDPLSSTPLMPFRAREEETISYFRRHL